MSKLKQAAIWITLLAIVLKFIGFIREVFIAKEFGANDYTDGFILAFTFVTLLKTLIKNGFNSVFLPEYLREKRKDEEQADKNANSMLNYTIVILLLVSAVCYLFTPAIVQVYGDMSHTTEIVATKMTRIFFMFMLVIGLTSVLESYLQAVRSFVPTQIVDLLGTLVATLFIIFFADVWGIYSIAYGFITGLCLGLVIQLYYLFKYGYKWKLTLQMDRAFAKRFFILFIPSLLHASIGHINVFVDKIFASGTVSGAVTYLNNSSLLMSIPSTIFQTTVLAIIFTLLSEQNEQKEKFKETLFMGYQIGIMALVPIAVGLWLVAEPAISFVYERGAYTSEDARNTVIVLYNYLPMLVTMGLLLVPIKAMYALGKTRKLLLLSSTTVFLNVLLNYLFLKWFGYPGLALSSSIVSFYYVTLVSMEVYRDFPKGEGRRVLGVVGRMILPCGLMALPIVLLQWFTPLAEWAPVLQLILLVPTGIVFYVLGLFLFYKEGFHRMVEFIQKKAKK